MNELTNVTTGEVRLSYAHLFKPYAAMQGQEPKYSVTVLVPKADTDTMNRINAAIEAAKQKGITDKWNGQCPPMLHVIFLLPVAMQSRQIKISRNRKQIQQCAVKNGTLFSCI